jgi:hypothetical protein
LSEFTMTYGTLEVRAAGDPIVPMRTLDALA